MSTLLGHLELVVDFLMLTRLSPPNAACVVEGANIVVASSLTNTRRIVATGVEALADLSLYVAASDEVLVIVCTDYNHAKELLLYNNTRTLSLMDRRVLVVHKLGMMCSLRSRRNYGVTWCNRIGNEALDRREVVTKCANRATTYDQLLGSACNCSHKPTQLLYHRASDPLVTFGVEYVFCVFRLSHELGKRLDQLTYIIKHEGIVNAATIV